MKGSGSRICLYPKDIQLVTGKSERTSQKMLNTIKRSLKKKVHQLVSLEEFCSYTGLPLEEVKKIVNY